MSAIIMANSVVTDGLVLYLDAANTKSYPTTGTTWSDLSGYSNNGILTNGPTFSSNNGGSIVFDGSNDSIIISNTSSLSVGNNLSVFSWFYINSIISYQPIVAKSLNNNGWELANSNGFLRCTLRPSVSNNNNIQAGTLNLNKWYYGGFTCDNITIKLFLNSISQGTTTVSSINLNTTSPLYVGQRSDGANTNYFNGNISTTQIYNRALSATEVLQNYNSTKARFGL